MKRFFIKSIGASGPKVDYSSVSFEPGVNIIHGPSNSGKSYVIGCINFMLGGSEPPFSRDSTGYDTIEITFKSLDGSTVQVIRKIVDGEKSEVGEKTVVVESTYFEIESGTYSIAKGEYSDLLLKLIGIEKRHKIISTQEFKTQSLTNRSFFHSFFIDEDNIYEKRPAFDVPGHSKITASLTALHFLFTGRDLLELIPQESKEERDIRLAQKAAVIKYINEKIRGLSERRGSIEQEIAEIDSADIEAKMDSTLEEISNIEHQISEATEYSRKLVEEMFDISSKLEEATFLLDRYKALHTQYNADVKRLRFIIDGESKISNNKRVVKCPFCESKMDENTQPRISYSQSAQAELDRITMQIEDLKEAEKDIKKEIESLEKRLEELKQKNSEVTEKITHGLKPKVAQLRGILDSYKRVVLLKQELSAVDTIASDFGEDANTRENEEDGTVPKFNAMKHFDAESWKLWNDIFDRTVKSCQYPNCLQARLSHDTYDAVINGKNKKDEGKGYRAFINSIILFSLMKALEETGAFRPAMLILDSPILTLKEKVREDEMADTGMRVSLFNHMIKVCGDNQIILVENEIPDSSVVDYSSANMIEFTQDEARGRYGFLRNVF